MTPAEFTDKWTASPVIKFRLSSPLADGLSEGSSAALREYGLPQNADPWLSFMEFAALDPQTVRELDERGLFPIGCLANGSFICIEKKSDRLMIFDRQDPDEDWTLNSSLEAMYESIYLFADFIREVNRRNPKFSSDFRIPEGILPELERKLTACDSGAMESRGFWHCELKALDDGAF